MGSLNVCRLGNGVFDKFPRLADTTTLVDIPTPLGSLTRLKRRSVNNLLECYGPSHLILILYGRRHPSSTTDSTLIM
jgi:hypothetical protein